MKLDDVFLEVARTSEEEEKNLYEYNLALAQSVAQSQQRVKNMSDAELIDRAKARNAVPPGLAARSVKPQGVIVFRDEFTGVNTVTQGKRKDVLTLAQSKIVDVKRYTPIARVVDDVCKNFQLYIGLPASDYIKDRVPAFDLMIYYDVKSNTYSAEAHNDSGSLDTVGSKKITAAIRN